MPTYWCNLSKAKYLSLFLTIIFCFFIVWIAWPRLPRYNIPDSSWYFLLAEGQQSKVISPYPQRFLHPFIVRKFSQFTGIDLYVSYYYIFLINFTLLLYSIFFILTSKLKNLWLIPLMISIPFLLRRTEYYCLPDSLHVALLALFFIALSKELLFLGLPLLFLLFITRESTIVIAFILFGLLLYRKRRAEAISVAAVCIVAMAIIHLTTRNLPENIHNVTPLQYMILKVPYNLAIHFFGLRLWTNTHIWSDPPIWKVVLPHWLAIGNIREIGFLRFELLTPLRTLTTALTIGGIFMPLCWWHLRRSFSKILSTCDLWLSTALIYGLCSWLLAPSLGALVTKYYDSSWPAFCLAGPILLERYFDNKRKLIILLILGNLMYWIPSLLDLFGFLPKSQI